ncbi:MAG: NHL repeat-containing protein [Planctomycetota bacterium]
MKIARGLAAVVLMGAAAPAFGQEFIANHVFVVSAAEDRIREFDLNGILVREFGASLNMQNPIALAFAPNGNLYLLNGGTSTIFEIDKSGNKVAELGGAAGLSNPQGLAIGPHGNVFVTSQNPDRIVELDRNGTKIRDLAADANLSAPSHLLFCPDGHVWVSSTGNHLLIELNSAGTKIREVAHIDLAAPKNLFFTAEGYINVLSSGTGRIIAFAPDGSVARSFAGNDWNAPSAAISAPDGNILIFDSTTTQFHAVDATGKSIRNMDGIFINPGIVAAAASPVRFSVRVSGGSLQTGKKQLWIKEDAVISYFPAGRSAMLQLTDKPNKSNDLASTAGRDVFVYFGFERFASLAPPSRAFQGSEVPANSLTNPSGSFSFISIGSIDANAAYSPVRLKGTLQLLGPAMSFAALVASTSRLN